MMDHFVSEHWDMMKVLPEKGNEGKRIYTHSGIEGKKDAKVEVLCGDDYFDGLWYKGPVKIVDCETGEAVWDIEEQAKERKLWVEYTDPSTGQAYKGFRTPWRIAGLYADIERWMFGGIGMTTYTLNAKDQLTLWSQQDTSGSLGLTDREKMRLRYPAIVCLVIADRIQRHVTFQMADKLCNSRRRKPRASRCHRRRRFSRRRCRSLSSVHLLITINLASILGR